MLMCVLGSYKKTGFEKKTLDSLHLDLVGSNIYIAHYIFYLNYKLITYVNMYACNLPSITLDINELFVVWYF